MITNTRSHHTNPTSTPRICTSHEAHCRSMDRGRLACTYTHESDCRRRCTSRSSLDTASSLPQSVFRVRPYAAFYQKIAAESNASNRITVNGAVQGKGG